MLKLTDRAWKAFKISELFKTINDKGTQVPTGAYIHKNNLYPGKTPRITVTSQNNGIDNYWNTDDKNKRTFSNFISVNFLGNAFYQKGVATLDMKVHALILNNKILNEYLALFLIATINNNIANSSYGNQLSSTDLPKKNILLPTNENGKPDYQFMEDFIKEREAKKRQEYIDYCKEQLKLIGGGYNLVPLAEKKWGAFFIGGKEGLFEIYSGKRLTVANMHEGTCPFIGSTDSNNGITNWISNRNETYDSNLLGVNYNGSVAMTFYHPYHCVFSDDVKRLHLKDYVDNQFVLLFLGRMILMQQSKYTYGYKFNGVRMNRQKILVPITDEGTPDYDYMEKYSKNLLSKKIQSYLDYLAS